VVPAMRLGTRRMLADVNSSGAQRAIADDAYANERYISQLRFDSLLAETVPPRTSEPSGWRV